MTQVWAVIREYPEVHTPFVRELHRTPGGAFAATARLARTEIENWPDGFRVAPGFDARTRRFVFDIFDDYDYLVETWRYEPQEVKD